MSRPSRTKKPLINFDSTRDTIEILRKGNQACNSLQDSFDETEIDLQCLIASSQCRSAMKRLQEGDLRYIAAAWTLKFIQCGGYEVCLRLTLVLKRLLRWLWQELFIAFLIPLQLFIIVVTNLLMILLFIFLLPWLLDLF